MTKSTVTAVKPAFKVGDYITNDKTVMLRVVAVLNNGLMPVYGLMSPKKPSLIGWETAYEVAESKYEKVQPDFEAYRKLAPGDILKMGHTDDREYMRVLVRVDDLVLLSETPDTESVKKVNKLADQLKDLTDGQLDIKEHMDADDRDYLRRIGSTTRAAKTAGNWFFVDHVCLMNWPIVSEA